MPFLKHCSHYKENILEQVIRPCTRHLRIYYWAINTHPSHCWRDPFSVKPVLLWHVSILAHILLPWYLSSCPITLIFQTLFAFQNVLCFLCIPVLYCNIIHAYYAFSFLLQYLRWTGLSVHFKHYVSPASNFESLKAVSPEAEPETYTKWPEKYNDILNLMQSSTVSFVILAGLMVFLRSWRCSFLLCCFGLHHIKRCIPSAYLYQLQTNLKT